MTATQTSCQKKNVSMFKASSSLMWSYMWR